MMKRMILSLMCVFTMMFAFSANAAFAASDGYFYTSSRFGYTIKCPQKPIAVMDLSIFSPQEKGDILVFANDGYNLTKYWVVSPEAFSNDTFPDLDNISEQDAKDLFAHLMVDREYETVTLVPVNGHNAIYAVTAKTIQIDSNKDGEIEQTIQAPQQSIETYLKGKKSNYCIVVTTKGELTQDDVNAYQYGLLSFREN